MSKKGLIIVGHRAFAEIAHEYFTHDSDYEVRAFAVDPEFKDADSFRGLPLVDVNRLPAAFLPADHEAFVALTYRELNRARTRLVQRIKQQGYALASYVSSHAFVWRNASIGENTFIFENNVVQPFVTIGNNVILWSGNHIGHHSKIGSNVFISSHVVVSGYCSIGDNCFFGVNSTVGDGLTVGSDCWIGPGALLTKDVPENAVVVTDGTSPSRVPARRFQRVKES
jgi:sugar O-acyltransferase (sialic acid O-acetyltransferase NeuD family)